MKILTLGLDSAIWASLQEEGFVVDTAQDADDVMSLMGLGYDYFAVIYQTNDPLTDLVIKLRKGGCKVPIIILSELHDTTFRCRSLDKGADQCLMLPIDKRELIAYVKATIRRSCAINTPQMKFGDLVLDTNAQMVEFKGRDFHVTKKEYQILELLMHRQGQVIPKETFLDHLYSTEADDPPHAKIVDVFVCKLRKRLRVQCGITGLINTVWGRGYVLTEDMTKFESSHDNQPATYAS